MFERPAEKSGTGWRIGWSVILHAALLFVLFRSSHAVRVRAFLPGTPKGTHIDLSYLPGGAAPSAPQSVRKQAPAVVRESRLRLPPRLTPPAPAPASDISTSSPTVST